MSGKAKAKLRRGWTTGACAAAASRAASVALRTGSFPDPVSIRLPGGEQPVFPLALKELSADGARAGVVKDAGDDPDVTHGALVIAELRRLAPGSGIRFRAGPGIGTVTLPGLPLGVGEPAINPGPRALIAAALAEGGAAPDFDPPDLEVTLSIPGGEALAALLAGSAPDLILMDCHMPGLDGWETTRRLRAWAGDPDPVRQRVAALPVVALTAAALPDERRRCLEAGMNEFLTKPVKLAELQDMLQRFVPVTNAAR